MSIGVVACGYADGYPRHAPTGTPVLVGGQRTRTVGRVSMDMLCVDISDIPEAYVGTPVTLWGEGLSGDEVAAAAGTVSYELLCALAPRVPVSRSDSRNFSFRKQSLKKTKPPTSAPSAAPGAAMVRRLSVLRRRRDADRSGGGARRRQARTAPRRARCRCRT